MAKCRSALDVLRARACRELRVSWTSYAQVAPVSTFSAISSHVHGGWHLCAMQESLESRTRDDQLRSCIESDSKHKEQVAHMRNAIETLDLKLTDDHWDGRHGGSQQVDAGAAGAGEK